jgi:arginyl-tRNA synthetase
VQNLIAKLHLLLQEQGLVSLCNTIELRRHESPYADVRLFLNEQFAEGPSSAVRLADALNQLPEVSSVKLKKWAVSVRLSDDFIESAGRELELGCRPAGGLPEAGDGNRYLIGFLGPNTSKALHLGHLRNIIIGNALACAFASAGAASRSYSLVGDIGRNVCEAMAGYQLFHDGERPERAGLKSDHFVGRCYQDYLNFARNPQALAGAESDPCAREHVPTGDLADELLQRWRSGDPAATGLWGWFRDMVEAGHDETLKRLGVVVDGCYYESEHLDLAREIIGRGLENGTLERSDDGMVIYNTGREEFRKIVLARSDGFPTEHGRVLAVFHHILAESEVGCTHIDWNGTEWEPAQTVLHDLMRAMSLIPGESTHLPVFHGMVLFDGEKMSSSQAKEPVLVDDLIEKLRQSPQVADLMRRAGTGTSAAAIADIVLKGFFLCEPLSKPVTYSWEKLVDRRANHGWLIARAWCAANSAEGGEADEGPRSASQSAYRVAVVQAHGLPRALSHVIRTATPESLVRYLLHFCERYLADAATAATPRLRGVALTVLNTTLESLGFSTNVDRPTSLAGRKRAHALYTRLQPGAAVSS